MISQLANKLSNFTTTSVQLEPVSGRSELSPGGVVEFHLPSESIVNLNSFVLSFVARAFLRDGVSPSSPDFSAIVRLPAGIEGLIEDVSVWCGGVRLDSGSQHFGKKRALLDRNMGVCGDAASHPTIQRLFDRHTGYTNLLEYEAPRRYATRRLCEGFLGAGMVDTSLMPQLTVRIEFTRRAVISFSNSDLMALDSALDFETSFGLNASSFPYETSGHYAIVEIVSAGPSYDAMQERIMSSLGHIPIPFKRFHAFQTGINENELRFNISTRSLDRVYFCTDAGDAGAGAPWIPNAKGTIGTGIDVAERGLDTEVFDSRRFMSTAAASNDATAYMTLAGARVPSFNASVQDWYSITQNSLPKPMENDVPDIDFRMDMAAWRAHRSPKVCRRCVACRCREP